MKEVVWQNRDWPKGCAILYHKNGNTKNPSLYHQLSVIKLDGVGPVDNRPSTDKFHHFVQKKKERKITLDT